jgi:hypothetical protein
MTNDLQGELEVHGEGSPELASSTQTANHVEEIKEAVEGTVSRTSLPDKVEDLRFMLENLSTSVDSWQAWHKNDYLAVIETLKSQVEDIQQEWDSVSASVRSQSERIEYLIQSCPGVIETATLKALSLRVAHLEQLVSQLFQESQAITAAKGTRRQFVISLIALGITIVLWGIFIGINILR